MYSMLCSQKYQSRGVERKWFISAPASRLVRDKVVFGILCKILLKINCGLSLHYIVSMMSRINFCRRRCVWNLMTISLFSHSPRMAYTMRGYHRKILYIYIYIIQNVHKGSINLPSACSNQQPDDNTGPIRDDDVIKLGL